VRELGGDGYELGVGCGSSGRGEERGSRRPAMEVSIIMTCEGDLCSSYEGSYGVRGDVCVTGESS